MREEKKGYSPDIQAQRDELAHEVKDIRRQRDKKRKQADTVLGRLRMSGMDADTLNARAKNTLSRGRRTIEKAVREHESGWQEIASATTDHNLLRWYFKTVRGNTEAHPIATDTFIDKSRQEYNPAWLARELVQNFVDHNPHDRGTLNGVKVKRENLPSKGEQKPRRYTITGDWAFEDPTGVISPHSEKPAGVQTAGGNGIGLKQTAIRYLRDFGVSRFEIQGEHWAANYELVRADEVNSEIEAAAAKANRPNGKKVRHDWLVGQLRPTEEGGRCAYVIETDNPEVMAALDRLDELGVSEINPYLQDPDFVSARGAIKWLPPTDRQPSREGRLFINGQVMNYGRKGRTAEDYWVGPEFATIQLNDIKYQMSVDRPPVSRWDLSTYVGDLVRSMSTAELVEQIKTSEVIWARAGADFTGNSDKGADVLIGSIVSTLTFKGDVPKDELAAYFEKKKYLAYDLSLPKAQIKELEAQGYTICPSDFKRLGMPEATSKLTQLEVLMNQPPDVYRARSERERLAAIYGIQVGYEELEGVKNAEDLLNTLLNRLDKFSVRVEESRFDDDSFDLDLQVELPTELLSHPLFSPKTDEQKLLYFVRGAVCEGLKQGSLSKAFLSQGERFSTFAVDRDSIADTYNLVVRNHEYHVRQDGVKLTLVLKPQAATQFREILAARSKPKAGSAEVKVKPVSETKPEAGEVAIDKPVVPAESTDETDADKLARVRGLLAPEVGEDVVNAKRGMVEVPVTHAPKPVRATETRVVKKTVTLAPEEEARLAKLEEKVPELRQAVETLETIANDTSRKRAAVPTSIDQYLAWRQSPDFYGEVGKTAQYLTGRHLLEILTENNRADIAIAEDIRPKSAAEKQVDELRDVLKAVVKRMAIEGHEVDEFELVTQPTEKQLRQLGLLRTFARLATGVDLPNDLFVYRGTGSKGINLGKKAIGLHEALFDTSFEEIYRTLVHEIAHNEAMSHGVQHTHLEESLFATGIGRDRETIRRMFGGEGATDEDRALNQIYEDWLRVAQVSAKAISTNPAAITRPSNPEDDLGTSRQVAA